MSLYRCYSGTISLMFSAAAAVLWSVDINPCTLPVRAPSCWPGDRGRSCFGGSSAQPGAGVEQGRSQHSDETTMQEMLQSNMGSRARLEVVPLLNFQSTVCVSRALPLSFRCCCSPVFPHDYSVNSSRASSRSDTCLISHTWACLGLPPANLCLNKMRDPKNKFGCKEDGGGGFV